MNKWKCLKNNYIDKGIKIIPIQPNKKIPIIPKWNEDCSCDKMQILYWYEFDHNMNFAIPCYENNLFVLDLDRHDSEKDGLKSFNDLCCYLQIEEPKTLIQQTPSGGLHYIFKSDDDLSKVVGLANAFENYPGIDLRNRNYILAEPSVINGSCYKFLNNYEPQEIPQKLKEFILENVGTRTEIKNKTYERPNHVDVGDRDNQMFLYINNLYFHTRLNEDEIRILAEYFNESVFDKPLPESVINYKIRKVFSKDRGSCLYIKLDE